NPYFLAIDEAHELWATDQTVSMKSLANGILRMTDAKKPGNERVMLTDKVSVPFDPSIHMLVLATNHPAKLGPAKGDAIKSRLHNWSLSPFSPEGLHKILSGMLAKASVKADANS